MKEIMVITSSSKRDRATNESALYTWTTHIAADLMGGVEEAACIVFWLCFVSRLKTHEKGIATAGPRKASWFRVWCITLCLSMGVLRQHSMIHQASFGLGVSH